RYKAGKQGVTRDLLRESERFWVRALASEYTTTVDYQNALLVFEVGRAALRQRHNIVIDWEPPKPKEGKVLMPDLEKPLQDLSPYLDSVELAKLRSGVAKALIQDFPDLPKPLA